MNWSASAAARPLHRGGGDRRADGRLGRRTRAARGLSAAPARDLRPHGILLIFDEVITGFGRIGERFAAMHFGVRPDLMTMAKGLTNGAVPMGAVFVDDQVYDAFMHGPEHAIELFHGYTYSGHPVACAAALATLEIYTEEGLFKQANDTRRVLAGGSPRSRAACRTSSTFATYGLVAGIELAPREDSPAVAATRSLPHCFHKRDVLIRTTGDIIALSPPLIVRKSGTSTGFSETLREAIEQRGLTLLQPLR